MLFEKDKLFIDDIDVDKRSIASAKLVRAGNGVGSIISVHLPPQLHEDPRFFIAGNDDIPGRKSLRINGDEVPLFASDRIEYPGQPLFIATHPDPQRLTELCSQIEIKVREEPPFSLSLPLPEDALLAAHCYKQKKFTGKKPVEPLFRSAKTVLSQTYSTGPQEHFYTGHQGALIEKTKDSFQITVSSEWHSLVRQAVADTLAIDPASFSVVLSKSAPAFYGKLWLPALLAAQLAVLFTKVPKKLQLIFTREEDIRYTSQRAPVTVIKKSAFNADNELTAEQTRIVIDGGAFPVFSDLQLESAVASCKGLYQSVPTQITADLIRTHHPPMDFFSGTTVSPLQFATERHLDYCADFFKQSPLEYRLARFAPLALKNGLPQLMQTVTDTLDYQRKKAAFLLNRNRDSDLFKQSKGIGLSCGLQGNGYRLSDAAALPYRIRLYCKDAAHLQFYPATAGPSQKTMIIWKEHLHRLFGVPVKNIDIVAADSMGTHPAPPPFSDNPLYLHLLLINRAASDLKAQWEAKAFPIDYETSLPPSLLPKPQFPPFQSATVGACGIEIQMDPISHEMKPLHIAIAVQCGQLQNRVFALQHIRLCVEQSLHWIKTDQRLNPDAPLTDVVLPSLSQLPRLTVSLSESDKAVPYGISELIFSLVPAAFCSAVSQLLNREITSIPIPGDPTELP